MTKLKNLVSETFLITRKLFIYSFNKVRIGHTCNRMICFFQAFLLHPANFNRHRHFKRIAILPRTIVADRATGRGKAYRFTSFINTLHINDL